MLLYLASNHLCNKKPHVGFVCQDEGGGPAHFAGTPVPRRDSNGSDDGGDVPPGRSPCRLRILRP